MIFFVLVELAKKVKIGRDGLASLFDKLVRVVRLETQVLHEISDGECGRARDAGQTMNEHFGVGFATLLDEAVGHVEIGQNLLAVAVVDRNAQKIGVVDEGRLGACGAHVQYVGYV